jgi:hypothetical protein
MSAKSGSQHAEALGPLVDQESLRSTFRRRRETTLRNTKRMPQMREFNRPTTILVICRKQSPGWSLKP